MATMVKEEWHGLQIHFYGNRVHNVYMVNIDEGEPLVNE
jgi:hypothetical protein